MSPDGVLLRMRKRQHIEVQSKAKKRSLESQMNYVLLSDSNVTFCCSA